MSLSRRSPDSIKGALCTSLISAPSLRLQSDTPSFVLQLSPQQHSSNGMKPQWQAYHSSYHGLMNPHYATLDLLRLSSSLRFSHHMRAPSCRQAIPTSRFPAGVTNITHRMSKASMNRQSRGATIRQDMVRCQGNSQSLSCLPQLVLENESKLLVHPVAV